MLDLIPLGYSNEGRSVLVPEWTTPKVYCTPTYKHVLDLIPLGYSNEGRSVSSEVYYSRSEQLPKYIGSQLTNMCLTLSPLVTLPKGEVYRAKCITLGVNNPPKWRTQPTSEFECERPSTIVFVVVIPRAFQKYSICWVYGQLWPKLYLCICICVFACQTPGNIVFEVLAPRASQKYSTCMVHSDSDYIGRESATGGAGIWVTFCRTGKMSVFCPFFKSRRLVWPNQAILMTSFDLRWLIMTCLCLWRWFWPLLSKKTTFYGTLNLTLFSNFTVSLTLSCDQTFRDGLDLTCSYSWGFKFGVGGLNKKSS